MNKKIYTYFSFFWPLIVWLFLVSSFLDIQRRRSKQVEYRLGAANIQVFGSVKTEEGLRALLAMDGYLKVQDGVKYPAALLTTGMNDSRVNPWMSAKMVARLQADSASGKPVLQRINYDAGHSSETTKEQSN